MAFRKRGTLLPLERRILEAALRQAPEGVYGFALAQELATGQGRSLVAHGTLYKALDRLRAAGLLTSSWEDAETAATEGRPRRRVYVVTAKTSQALERPQQTIPDRRLGEAPA